MYIYIEIIIIIKEQDLHKTTQIKFIQNTQVTLGESTRQILHGPVWNYPTWLQFYKRNCQFGI